MGSFSAASALQRPVSLRGISLGQPTDLVLDLDAWRAIGFVVHCRDESVRFLPYGAAQLGEEEIAVQSALMLLEDVSFYQERGASFRSLLDGEVAGLDGPAGVLRDLVIGRSGAVEELELERGGTLRRVPAFGSIVVPTRASAA